MNTRAQTAGEWTRRELLKRLGLGGLLLHRVLNAEEGLSQTSMTSRPHLFVRSSPLGGMRTVADIRRSISSGLHKVIWAQILEQCETDLRTPVLTARSVFPERYLAAAKKNNPDYTICHAVGQRILRYALVMLVTEDERFKHAALDQLRALFDESVWPDWIDQAHLRFGHPADLRTGMLSQDTGLAYDWLYPFLDASEREEIVEGIDRRGIQPFLTSMRQDPWWWHDMNNWYSVIIGGVGVAGMALQGDHPEADRLVDISLKKMKAYLGIYGKDGEFNESIAYSNATRIPVAYFYAYYYHSLGNSNPLADHPFPETAEWTIHLTLPPGRYAAFGDGWVGQPPMVEFMAAIASATRNPVTQNFVEYHLKASSNPYVLLWLDGGLDAKAPDGILPLGRVYEDNGAHVVSRTDWDPVEATMVVYGKAKRDHNHGHNDVGQVCIDGFGERLIIDPGSPSSYPVDFFDEGRYHYYNASARGHNVLMFGGREPRHPPHNRGAKDVIDWDSMNGVYLGSDFFADRGGYWQMDLTRAYDGAKRVKRTVIHLFPGLAVVYDEADLLDEEEISLRWHTITEPELDASGQFGFYNQTAGLAAGVFTMGTGEASYRKLRHEYRPPYDRDRDDGLLEKRLEPYVEAIMTSDQCRFLSVFALKKQPDDVAPRWFRDDERVEIETQMGAYSVSLKGGSLRAANLTDGTEISVDV